MQSTQPLNASAVTSSSDSDDMDPIAYRTRLSKRTRSQMEAEIDGVNGPNLDILERFPILLCQYVFQHLNRKELLEMSEVNREWNKLAGESAQMRKLKLVINHNNRELTLRTKEILKKSRRMYQNIDILMSPKVSKFSLSFLAKRAGSWKSVNLKTCMAIPKNMWPKALQTIEPSVEDLTISDRNHPDQPWDVVSGWTFPNLKALKCNTYAHNVFKYFGFCTSLFRFVCYQLEEMTDVNTILRNNLNLKDLQVVELGGFFERASEFKFKLQNLLIESRHRLSADHHFVSFLITQAQHLESLTIYSHLDQELLEIILGMPSLTSLKTCCSISEEIQELPVNNKITTVDLFNPLSCVKRNDFRTVIRAMPNIKILKCRTIEDELLLFLSQEVPALESLSVFKFDVTHIPEGNIFPNVKNFTVILGGSRLQEPIGNSKFAELVQRQMRFMTRNNEIVGPNSSD